MVPQPKSYKSGVQQFAEFFYVMNHCSPVQKSMWIKVTSPNDWPLNYTSNINFINSITKQATGYGVAVGIYTSANDWKQITNGYSGLNSGIKLWWKDTFGAGSSGESPPNFDDFRQFGSWNAPTVKQFSEDYPWCGMTINRNVMLASSSWSP
ncbi:hypothetical protein Aduo_004123 [Ancylostoma duodenale]